MSKVHIGGLDPVYWAAVCDCGWAASSAGTSAGRHRIEQLGISHSMRCDDQVTLERRGSETEDIKTLEARWYDDGQV